MVVSASGEPLLDSLSMFINFMARRDSLHRKWSLMSVKIQFDFNKLVNLRLGEIVPRLPRLYSLADRLIVTNDRGTHVNAHQEE